MTDAIVAEPVVEASPLLWRRAKPPAEGNFGGFDPGVRVEDGVMIESDVVVTMRDGVELLADVYQPVGSEDLPALMIWGQYGKKGGHWTYDLYPNRAGVPEDAVGPWAKFEGPDPARWCKQGYAIVHPDARGSWRSGGDMATIGGIEARDSYDTIEWIAEQAWSNGKVGMAGCSWLAVSQWHAAALRPPHLVAISPWEGWTDLYREMVAVGGIVTDPDSAEWLWGPTFGQGLVEDVPAMAIRHPFWNEYWASKRPDLEAIDIPAYVVASWTNVLHSRGTLEGFERITSERKWLRVHDSQEWRDFLSPERQAEVQRFFDRYLKDIDNGWESTPRIRLSILDETYKSHQREEKEWPPKRTRHEALHLDALTHAITTGCPAGEASTTIDADTGQAVFTIRFDEETELTGHMSLKLWLEVQCADDADLYVVIDKLDANGDRVPFQQVVDNRPAAHGQLRASHRELDPTRSRPGQPWHRHARREPLRPGEVVPVEIEFWPLGVLWHPGDQLRLTIAGMPIGEQLTKRPPPPDGAKYVLRTGGRYDSHLLAPRIPHGS